MHDFVNGLKNLMDENTIFIYENPYLLDTFKGLQFDTMYYEHISYFSLFHLEPLLLLMKAHHCSGVRRWRRNCSWCPLVLTKVLL